jgi:hypothetical protein
VAGTGNRSRTRRILAWVAPGLAVLALAVSPAAAMRSERIGAHLCKTVNGGRFVPIPGFPGERIDRRLIPDIRWMKHNFNIFITDGYSTDPAHALNGEHPIGLATDIVPNGAKGGTWRDIGNLAHFAEPKQDLPIAPWRWVGWNGDAGHGRGDHLHISWMHSPTEPKDPARVVYTRRCPTPIEPPSGGGGGGNGGDGHRQHGHRHHNGGTRAHRGGSDHGGGGSSGGTSPGDGRHRSRGSSGGTSAGAVGRLAPVVPEDA